MPYSFLAPRVQSLSCPIDHCQDICEFCNVNTLGLLPGFLRWDFLSAIVMYTVSFEDFLFAYGCLNWMAFFYEFGFVSSGDVSFKSFCCPFSCICSWGGFSSGLDCPVWFMLSSPVMVPSTILCCVVLMFSILSSSESLLVLFCVSCGSWWLVSLLSWSWWFSFYSLGFLLLLYW